MADSTILSRLYPFTVRFYMPSTILHPSVAGYFNLVDSDWLFVIAKLYYKVNFK